MVDGILASCYPSVDHDVAHIAIAPMRWFPRTVEWIFGVENGKSAHLKLSHKLGLLFIPGTRFN